MFILWPLYMQTGIHIHAHTSHIKVHAHLTFHLGAGNGPHTCVERILMTDLSSTVRCSSNIRTMKRKLKTPSDLSISERSLPVGW